MRLKKLGQYRRQCWQAAVSGLAIVLLSLVSFKLHFNAATVVLLYLLVIVWQSLAGGFALSATVAIMAAACLDFFFLPPLLSLRIADPLNVLAFVVFLVIALLITHLVSRLARGSGFSEPQQP
jgi:two-component system, OmpR family, sensor histidine kinase KdpD